MSRTPSSLDGRRAMALLVVGVVFVTCPEVARAAIASLGANEANLDYAVSVETGAWCTEKASVPEGYAQVPWTLEGWFRPAARSAGVLIDVRDVGARTPWVRLSLDTSLRPRVQTKQATKAVGSLTVRADVWTHYALHLDLDGARLRLWDAENRERSVVLAAFRRSSAPSRMRVCVGGGSFRGLADEVRVWGAELSASELRGWRHRRVTPSHPHGERLLGYWPFRSGAGSSEPDLGAIGPMRTADARWVALPRLHYGPLLRSMGSESVSMLFGARGADGGRREWKAGLDVGTSPDLEELLLPSPRDTVTDATDWVAHLTLKGLAPQTRHYYVPMIDGRRGFDGEQGGIPSFVTAMDLGRRNADFTAVFLADQHPPNRLETTAMATYAAAEAAAPLFWAQLGDVVAGVPSPSISEQRREAEAHRTLWERNYAAETPQARFVRSFPLNLAAISDHEIVDNFSLQWHAFDFGHAATEEASTLPDRVGQYDASLLRWWNYFGWGPEFADRLGRAALQDHGESVMAEEAASLLEDTKAATACVAAAHAERFHPGDFVYVVDDESPVFHSRVARVEGPGSCRKGTSVVLAGAPAAPYRRSENARMAVGARYGTHGFYHSYQPFPFVEFFVLDTTSYRGDPYALQSVHDERANRDTDHSRYPWNPGQGRWSIFGDQAHGANRTTDGVRSWLGPTQTEAFLAALRTSTASVIVVAAGYPLYSLKFQTSSTYWPMRESGFDFATEVEELVSALDVDRLVLWVHGDGHTPALVRLRKNLYQVQVGPTLLGGENPGIRPGASPSGTQSREGAIGGGRLIAGHLPDLGPGDSTDDVFAGKLDQFQGYLRLYFHPGHEALRSSEQVGLRRGDSDNVVEMPLGYDPACGQAAQLIVGKVARLRFGDKLLHSVVSSYRYEKGRVVLTLEAAIVRTDPDELRILIDATPWVEIRWFDSLGREWRDLSFVIRKDP